MDKFIKACSHSRPASVTSHPNCWTAISNEFVKVKFDAPLFDDQNCLGACLVMRDSRGDSLLVF